MLKLLTKVLLELHFKTKNVAYCLSPLFVDENTANFLTVFFKKTAVMHETRQKMCIFPIRPNLIPEWKYQ